MHSYRTTNERISRLAVDSKDRLREAERSFQATQKALEKAKTRRDEERGLGHEHHSDSAENQLMTLRSSVRQAIHDTRVSLTLAVTSADERRAEVANQIRERKERILHSKATEAALKKRLQNAEAEERKAEIELARAKGESTGMTPELLGADLARLRAAARILGIS